MERALTTTPWFDEQDRLTPEELQTATFPLSRLGRRGYEEEPVRGFLRTVHAEFVRLVNERASLWQEVQRLRRRILAGGTDGDPQAVLFGEADAHIHAVRILSTAQVTADRYVADAQAYSSRVTEEARLRRDDIMREAQQHSEHDPGRRSRQGPRGGGFRAEPPGAAADRPRAAGRAGRAGVSADLQRRLPGTPTGLHRGCPARHRGVGAQGSSLLPGSSLIPGNSRRTPIAGASAADGDASAQHSAAAPG